MNDVTIGVRDLAREILSRLEGTREPGDRPQLLACDGEWGLLRGCHGLKDVKLDQLPSRVDLAPLVDHTLLKAGAWVAEIDQLCDEAKIHAFASVCVNPLWVRRCALRLQGGPVRVCTVVGFPLGAATSHIKAEEAREAVANGAHEVDMVLPIGLVKAGEWESVRQDVRAVREAIPGTVLKVILETCLLSDAEKQKACKVAADESVDFVKTSTGFSNAGATQSDIRLMREVVGARCGVKASGGIRHYEDALNMVLAGATRIGMSNSLAVVKGM